MNNSRINKKVLFIVHEFPPSRGPASFRTTAFVRFLPDYGWTPFVLTVSSKVYKQIDNDLMARIPRNISVIRTPSLEQNPIFKILDNISHFPQNIFQKICFLIFKSFAFPDIEIWWAPYVIKKGIKLCKRHNIDIIYATGPNFSSFIIAHIISKIAHKPYILDMRDPWSLNDLWGTWALLNKTPRSNFEKIIKFFLFLKAYLEKFFEYISLRDASFVICVGKTMLQGYQREYPRLAKKFIEISNGFFLEDMEIVRKYSIKANHTDKKKMLSYVGTLFPFKFHPLLIQALKEIQNDSPKILEMLKIVFVGYVDPTIRRIIDQESFRTIFSYLGEVTRDEAIKCTVLSDALLLLCRDSKWIQTSKVFDYMISGRPVIAIVPEGGEAEKVIKETGIGMVISEKQKLVEAIIELVEKGTIQSVSPKRENIRKYDRRYLTGRLASFLDEVVKIKEI